MKVEDYFIADVFEYGNRKDNCLAFQNIHITEKQKQTIRKAWEAVEKKLKKYGYLTDSKICETILSFFNEFIKGGKK